MLCSLSQPSSRSNFSRFKSILNYLDCSASKTLLLNLLPLDEQLTKRGRRGGGYIFSFYRKMLTFMHLCPPQRKIHASIITGSTPDVVPPVSIKCLKKPILGAATGPDMRVNGFQMEADQCAPSRMRTVLIKEPEQVRMLFPPTPHPPNFASEFLLCL